MALNYCDVVHIAGFGYPKTADHKVPIHYYGSNTMKSMKRHQRLRVGFQMKSQRPEQTAFRTLQHQLRGQWEEEVINKLNEKGKPWLQL
ncbi:UNVERIFIED_CONTAM: hypothetical protein FKN15_051848 [Acipenser sinensis]